MNEIQGEALCTSINGWLKLNKLDLEGQEAEDLRDTLDKPWHDMTKKEKDLFHVVTAMSLELEEKSQLPIECDVASYFMCDMEGRYGSTPQIGFVYQRNDRYDVHLSGLEYFTCEQGEWFGLIGNRLGKISKWIWLSNPLNMPEWAEIPDPPECKIYRFQYYQIDAWHNGTVLETEGMFQWSGAADRGERLYSKNSFWDCFGHGLEVTQFVWKDPCPELGEWQGDTNE